MATVKFDKDGKWGYIDKTGKTIIKPEFFDQAFNFSEGLASVQLGAEWGNRWVYINKKGVAVITNDNFIGVALGRSVKLSSLTNSQGGGAFTDGLAAVIQKEKKGFYEKGKGMTISFPMDGHSRFSEGLAYVQLRTAVDFRYKPALCR